MMRTTGSLDHHATYIVAAHVVGAAGNPRWLAAAPPGGQSRQVDSPVITWRQRPRPGGMG